MEVEDSNRATSNAAKMGNNRHRVWTVREEETLIQTLKEIITCGWKCENGFRTGYLMVLEKHMLNAFPGTDLRADPHINSKIHVWKKNYGSLCSMLLRSGFGWTDKTNMIWVESDDVWNSYVKIDGNAKGMRYKSFPFYRDWCEIFGKDRATGEHAVDFNDVAKEQKEAYHPVLNDDVEATGWNDFTNGIGVEDEDDFMSVCQPSPTMSDPGKKTKSKKRKSTEQSDSEIVGLMGSFCGETTTSLAHIAKRIGYEFDLSEK